MAVRHLSELISTPDGSEKRQVSLRRPEASRALVRARVLIIHSLMSISSGMLASAETSKIQADVSANWVSVSRGDGEFDPKRQWRSAHVLRRV